MRSPTIEACSRGRDNNFKLLRLVAASLVILGHSFSVVLGPSVVMPPAPWLPMSFGGLAVNIFFVLSGFLIAKSFDERGSVKAFVVARVLRIYPAAIVAILFTVFVVGWSFTTLPAGQFPTHPEVQSFLTRDLPLIFSPIRATLPGVFATNPTPHGVNDPLWTLPYEMWMYGTVLGIGLMGLLKRRLLFNLGAAAALAGYWFLVWFEPRALDGPAIGPLWRLAFFFLAGTAAYVNRDVVRLNLAAAAVAAVLVVLVHGQPWFIRVFDVALVYVVLVLAFVPGGKVREFNRVGDYSYGLYVFGFPIQQSLIALWPSLGWGSLFALSMIVGLAVAALSWRFIEAPALRLKDRGVLAR